MKPDLSEAAIASILLRPQVKGKFALMQKLRFRLPPPNLLITFEAAGRHLSFTKAAAELNVSRVAVSQQVQALERFLGIKLFQRLQRSVCLTQVGERYHLAISSALEKALLATTEITGVANKNIVNVCATPGFMTYWLLPNIGEFRSKHPDVELRFIVSDTHLGMSENIDIAIRYGTSPFDDADSIVLVRQVISPTCAGSYLANDGQSIAPADLLKHPLIHLEGPHDRQTRWSTWFQAHGIDIENPRAGITVNSYTNLVQAALDGQGFALIGPPLIQSFLANRTLIQPVDVPPVLCHAFNLLTPRQTPKSNASKAFSDWIRGSFARHETPGAPLHEGMSLRE
ncbi:LysR substrate-binding domain-containing protein [Mesorhizobium sp. M1403]|uniref:LysR substrate-binding domain-containing protein n=1 Tax=Mesorhizobium sp. M1403 TaxID=2957097 RepID=UPI00333C5657